MKKLIKLTLRLFVFMIVFVMVFYPVAVYSDIPFIKKWRDIYIETAMTTMHHQWLATSFIPQFVIDDVMNDSESIKEEQNNFVVSWENVALAQESDYLITSPIEEEQEEIQIIKPEEEFFNKYWELDSLEFRSFLSDHPEFLQNGYDRIVIENYKYEYDIKSTLGERIYLLDCPNNLVIFEIKKEGSVGKLATVKDSSQVRMAKSKTLGNYGTILRDFYTQEECLLAVNCSGFWDQEAKGNGGKVVGTLTIDGVEYGKPVNYYLVFGQKLEDDKFYIEKASDFNAEEYRWAAQFNPALVVNGEKKVKGTSGYGIQPRTAIGQATNGDMLLLIIDGRQIGYSLGASVSTLADIMLEHNAYQAVNCDGGSSSLMWYQGKNITKPSSTNILGRYLPDAIVVDFAK
jgi:exopolysaccharide biosynthesis protein